MKPRGINPFRKPFSFSIRKAAELPLVVKNPIF